MNPSHDYLHTLIQAAEELGVTILRVDAQSVTVTVPYGTHWIDVTLHAGPLLAATLLRSVLRPVQSEEKTCRFCQHPDHGGEDFPCPSCGCRGRNRP